MIASFINKTHVLHSQTQNESKKELLLNCSGATENLGCVESVKGALCCDQVL